MNSNNASQKIFSKLCRNCAVDKFLIKVYENTFLLYKEGGKREDNVFVKYY